MGHQHHNLKTEPVFFQQSWDGDKPFEIRFTGDRQFQKGDTVTLQEHSIQRHHLECFQYTGREITGRILFVTAFEQKDGYVVFSLGNIEKRG